ncbi:MAG: sensor histidine kinase [Microcoleaceae cyanobacterium]
MKPLIRSLKHGSKPSRRRWFDPGSLGSQLTIGIILFATLSLLGLSLWTSWRMQQLLVESHKDQIEALSRKISTKVEAYSEMMSQQTALEKAVNKPENEGHLIWIRDPSGNIIVQSDTFRDGIAPELRAELLTQTEMPIKPQVAQIGDNYLVLCGESFSLKGRPLGKLYLVNEITQEYEAFLSIFNSLIPATILILAILVAAIVWYIRRALQPLQDIGRLAETISADQLSNYRLQIDKAPSEVAMLAKTCNKMLDRLAESWEQQRQFVGNVSHELRTPLTIVRGYLQSTLRRGENLTVPQREGLAVAASEADRTIQLLQDLLELARADHGNLHFQIEPIPVNDLITEVVEMAKPVSQGRVEFEHSAEEVVVKADSGRLKQVLLNLIDNALKYSESDKLVTLRVQRQGKQGLISVCDRGQGIPLKDQTRIFERFYRMDEARNRAGGTGLGLSIVKTLVEGMGGQVTVRSQLNQGSIFTVFLSTVG